MSDGQCSEMIRYVVYGTVGKLLCTHADTLLVYNCPIVLHSILFCSRFVDCV